MICGPLSTKVRNARAGVDIHLGFCTRSSQWVETESAGCEVGVQLTSFMLPREHNLTSQY